ncbi:3-phosphoshikimate 1-carboxyvinyltransferase [Oleiagrimonas soli]|uniref:3-phosphoshikimate 1-carboxyvinyltransferase n=1 Tax=Oleiagrimonas soli TaxID=1543381 RepID=A0A099CWH1_9GAMM|nr:3-phosphoshikimate 1-carboxyvinyltransferase [Oleiagrimonas soli]KGI78338.1 3-phosphoshikimate 1-carboxyvinyltransferase [Oleiagrimonas soli]MBB6183163.1 3-phosphoshikimate 1-carboxyvinyltransferase [Oleiagrimonas soli]
MSARVDWIARPAPRAVQGETAVPGDKSVSHRAVMLAGIAEGVSHVHGFLEGEDTRATARIMQQLGVRMETPEPGQRIVHGVGLRGLRGSDAPLDCGNAGTGMRLLAGLLAGQAFDSTLVGDASLSRRPMRRVSDPLQQMGATIETQEGGLPPLIVRGGRTLHGIDYQPPMASAQVKSAVLLAGLYAEGETVVREVHPTRDYTERMLAAFGWPVEMAPGYVRLRGGGMLVGGEVVVPGDFSSAAFPLLAAAIVPGSQLRLRAVGLNPRRTGLLAVLRLMGADIRVLDTREVAGEALADLEIRHAPLRGIDVPVEHVSDMIDEFPALFVAAACAEGVTRVRGAAELRVKESDRIDAMARGLRALGVTVDETPDGADIVGRGTAGLTGGQIDSHGDHRIAMSFAVAAARATGDVRILDCAAVDTSFPGFVTQAGRWGLDLRASETR